jgi:hypothetical protein
MAGFNNLESDLTLTIAHLERQTASSQQEIMFSRSAISVIYTADNLAP